MNPLKKKNKFPTSIYGSKLAQPSSLMGLNKSTILCQKVHKKGEDKHRAISTKQGRKQQTVAKANSGYFS